jgi:hypothetical protein
VLPPKKDAVAEKKTGDATVPPPAKPSPPTDKPVVSEVPNPVPPAEPKGPAKSSDVFGPKTRVFSVANLRQVGLSLLQYKLEMGSFPNRVEDLEDILRQNPKMQRAFKEKQFILKTNLPAEGRHILAHEFAPNEDRKRLVLFSDGVAEMIPEVEFQKLIK